MWGSLGGLGDLYGVLHGCVGHWGGLAIITERYMGVGATRGCW